jgi:SAM-dependent methyltransferase
VLREAVPHLACPWCGAGELALDVRAEDRGGISEGSLGCGRCRRVTAVSGGIWDAMGPWTPSRSLAQLSNIVPLTARIYESLWRRRSLTLLSGRPFPLAEELDELVAAVDVPAGSLVVDVGCSEGLYARTLAARRGAVVLAVDHAVPFLRRARERALHEGVRVVAVRALAQHLPVRSGAAAAVVIGGSYNEIGDQGACMAEAGRVLEPGGRFFMMSLVASRTRPGKLVQALVRPSGITFPSVDETLDAVRGPGRMVIDTTARDAVVLRTTASRP